MMAPSSPWPLLHLDDDQHSSLLSPFRTRANDEAALPPSPFSFLSSAFAFPASNPSSPVSVAAPPSLPSPASPLPSSLSPVPSQSAGTDSCARLRLREERALRRKAQHQQLDIRRRHREATALQRLHRLSQLPLDNPLHSQREGSAEAKEGGALTVAPANGSSNSSRRRVRSAAQRSSGEGAEDEERPVKVRVLERAVAQMERLVQRFHRHCTEVELRDRHIAALHQQLRLVGSDATQRPPPPSSSLPSSQALSPTTFSFLSHLDYSASLNVFVRPLISLLLIRLPGYLLVDANSQHALETGWPSSSICNRSLAWTLSKDEYKQDVSPLVKKVERLPHDGGLQVKSVIQYPGNGKHLKDLVQGEKQTVAMTFRFYRPDGRLYETPCTAWLAAKESRNVDSGDVVVEPAGFVVLAAATAEALQVEDLQGPGRTRALRLPEEFAEAAEGSGSGALMEAARNCISCAALKR